MPEAKPKCRDVALLRYAQADIPTAFATFRVTVYRSDMDDQEQLLIAHGTIAGVPELLVRVHSECFTGEVLGSLRCDCRDQLEEALRRIAAVPSGAIVYLRQEGRGIGLGNKIRAYALQDQGLDTIEANHQLGFPADMREYDIAARILADQGVASVALLTNNPEKVENLETCGINVVRTVRLQIPSNPHSAEYLRTKRVRMGHLLDPRAT